MNGRHWYTEGKTSVFAFECPEGFTLGMLHNQVQCPRDPKTGRFMKKRG